MAGLDWTGLDQTGLDWANLARPRPVWPGQGKDYRFPVPFKVGTYDQIKASI